MIYDSLYEQSVFAGSAISSILTIAIYVLNCAGLWKIFTKAGEPGFAAIIPFYNTYKLFKIAMGNGWLFLLVFIPIINIVAYVLLAINLARSFRKGPFYVVGLIIIPAIFYIVLGFSDSQYYGPKGVSPFNPDEYDNYSNPVSFTDLNENKPDDYVVVNTPNVHTTASENDGKVDFIDADDLSPEDLEVETDDIIDVTDLTVELDDFDNNLNQ